MLCLHLCCAALPVLLRLWRERTVALRDGICGRDLNWDYPQGLSGYRDRVLWVQHQQVRVTSPHMSSVNHSGGPDAVSRVLPCDATRYLRAQHSVPGMHHVKWLYSDVPCSVCSPLPLRAARCLPAGAVQPSAQIWADNAGEQRFRFAGVPW